MPARTPRPSTRTSASTRATTAQAAASATRTLPADPDQALTLISAGTDPAILAAVRAYRAPVPAAEWEELATHVRLGLLAYGLRSPQVTGRYSFAVTHHVRAAFARGGDRSVPGIWAADQVEHTLAAGVAGVEERSVDAMAAPLRRISRALVPAGQPLQATRSRRYRRAAPYDSAELAALIDAVTTLAAPRWRARASLLVALTAGAGLTDADLATLGRDALGVADGDLVVAVSGPRARTVPVFADLVPLAAAAHTLLLAADPRLTDPGAALFPGRAVATVAWHKLTWPPGTPRPTAHRLRATWTALVLASGCGLPAFLTAAHITSLDSWYDPVTHLRAVDPGAYRRQVRGESAGPRPGLGAGRELDGQPWPAPTVPLRAGDPTGPGRR